MNKYTLVDCWERNKKHPKTFEIPTKMKLKELKVGSIVKLIFDDRERMWVEIMGKRLNTWIGRLDNKPYDLTHLKLNDEIEFENKHICEVI